MSAKKISATWASLGPFLQSLLRIVTAVLFMQPGMMKLFAYPMGIPPNGGTVRLLTELGLAGILETFGGALLFLGIYTRPVAFLLSGEMAVAYFQVHFPRGYWPLMNGGTDAVFYCFLWLFFSAAGAGPLSVDALRGK
ncbi:MAG: DoxX family protein [Bacteroidota bacterium]